MTNTVAVSFGSNYLYSRMAERMLRKLKRNYPNIQTKVYAEKDLDSDLIEYTRLFKRGFGYWIWKPYIVKKAIDKLNDGDVFLYIDARSGIPESNFFWLDNLIGDNQFDFVAWQLTTPEQSRTTGDLFSFLDVEVGSSFALTGQFAATFFSFRVGPLTRKLVSSWFDVVIGQRSICRDEDSFNLNHPSFLQSRYDQSVLSILLKKYEALGLRIYRIPEIDIFGGRSVGQHNKVLRDAQSIYPWATPHPFAFMKRVVNLLLRYQNKVKIITTKSPF